jgi:MFS family permease
MLSMMYGAGFAAVTSSTPALVSELTDEALMGTAMGFLGTIMDVGQTLGPIMTGFILSTGLGYVGSFAVLATILLVTCAMFVAVKISGKKIAEKSDI